MNFSIKNSSYLDQLWYKVADWPKKIVMVGTPNEGTRVDGAEPLMETLL